MSPTVMVAQTALVSSNTAANERGATHMTSIAFHGQTNATYESQMSAPSSNDVDARPAKDKAHDLEKGFDRGSE